MSDKDKLVRFLARFLSERKSLSAGDVITRIHHTLNLKDVANFIDLEKAAKLLGGFEADELSDEKLRLTVTMFNRQYEIFKVGNDPDSPYASLGLD